MLIGDKVILEEIDRENIEWMRNERNHPEMRQYFREWKDITKDQQERWYQSRGNNSSTEHVYFQIMAKALTHKSDETWLKERELIGCCGLHYIDWRIRAAEFGIFVSKKQQGRGLGKEALTMLCDFGFKDMNLNKIYAEVFDNNKAINLYKKLGFQNEGWLRDTYIKQDGTYGNSEIISVLRSEWFVCPIGVE